MATNKVGWVMVYEEQIPAPPSGTTMWYSGIHNNSGEFTYGTTLCPLAPSGCTPHVDYKVKAKLLNDSGGTFDDYLEECGEIIKELNGNSCNGEGLVMWFNGGDDNMSYNNILSNNNNIFDIKNVDECEHIIISNFNIRTGGQYFADSGYTDSGFPCIVPTSELVGAGRNNEDSGFTEVFECKYKNGTKYAGHKIKYRTLRNEIPTNTLVDCDDLVELYFPHLYESGETTDGANTELVSTIVDGINIETIGEGAFSGCSNLSAITLSSVKEIKKRAFNGCTSLAYIDWGHARCVEPRLEIIGEEAFRDNGISYMKTPLSLRTISGGAFYNCSSLSMLQLNNGLERIGNQAFYACGTNDSSSTLYISSSITSIGENAFSSCGFMNIIWDTKIDSSSFSNSVFTNIPSGTHICFPSITSIDYLESIYAKLNIPLTSTSIKLYVNSSLKDDMQAYVGQNVEVKTYPGNWKTDHDSSWPYTRK